MWNNQISDEAERNDEYSAFLEINEINSFFKVQD